MDMFIPPPQIVDQMKEPKPNPLELWKENNATIRQWETILFENSKNFFTAVTLAIGAAGAVVAWASVGISTQRIVVSLFLGVAIFVSIAGIVGILSGKNYLKRFYGWRTTLEAKLKGVEGEEPDIEGWQAIWRGLKSGWTITAVTSCFILAIVLCSVFLRVVWLYEPERAGLDGARLQGADLSAVRGLTQHDLDHACGDAKTKVPVGLTLRYCEPEPSVETSKTPASGSASQPNQSKKN